MMPAIKFHPNPVILATGPRYVVVVAPFLFRELIAAGKTRMSATFIARRRKK